MKIGITGKSENALLKRTELSFKVEDIKVPPSRKELIAKIAAMENTKPGQVAISKIEHSFGSKKVSGKAHIYSSAEQLGRVELGYLMGRDRGMKKKKGEEEKAAEKPEAAKKEEKEAKEVKLAGEKTGKDVAKGKKEGEQ